MHCTAEFSEMWPIVYSHQTEAEGQVNLDVATNNSSAKLMSMFGQRIFIPHSEMPEDASWVFERAFK